MCLILLGWKAHPDWRLAVAANRDEFRERPAAPLGWWADAPDVLAGRDLRGGGTWMGADRSGRFAALTNYRDPAAVRPNAPSRGELVSGFLTNASPPGKWLAEMAKGADAYNGFNLLVADGEELWYFGNRTEDGPRRLSPGIYGLSNRFLDTPWPKVERSRAAFRAALSERRVDPEALFRLLADRRRPPDAELPDTGVGLELERLLSAPFIAGVDYGTRASSVLLVRGDGTGEFLEREFRPENGNIRIAETRRMEIRPAESPRNP